MFKVIDNPEFVEDVPVDVPDGTGWRKDLLRTRFRALTVSDVNALVEDGGVNALLDRAVVGFEDLADESGKPVPGDGEWREKLLEYAFVRVALIRRYHDAQAGVRLGNSAPSAAPGPGAS